MSSELVELAIGANRLLTYAGYVLLAGTLTFWALVWPDGRSDRRLVAMSAGGTLFMVLGTLGGPAILLVLGHRQLGEVVNPLSGAALLVRLAVLVLIAFFLVDVVRQPVVGGRRVFALVVVTVIAATMVTQSNAMSGPYEALKVVATSGHVLATAAWLGGLVALAAVLIPRDSPQQLDRLIPRFSRLAVFSVITLVATGAVHALIIAGGVGPLVSSRYGLVLLVKVAVFGGMLLLGNHGRRYAARVAFAQRHHPPDAVRLSRGVHSLAVVMGTELAIVFVILATTALLVMVAPHA